MNRLIPMKCSKICISEESLRIAKRNVKGFGNSKLRRQDLLVILIIQRSTILLPLSSIIHNRSSSTIVQATSMPINNPSSSIIATPNREKK